MNLLENFITILGYAASFIVLVSLLMKSLVKLRFINAFGAALFVVFALKTNSLPTAFMNIGIVIIDIYYLIKLSNTKDNFDILQLSKNNEIVSYFYNLNKIEIDKMFSVDAIDKSDSVALFFRNNDIAGILSFTKTDANTAKIFIDFVVPKYRDCAVGNHFFVKDLSFWRKNNISTIEIENPADCHKNYLRKIGFIKQNNSDIWQKSI